MIEGGTGVAWDRYQSRRSRPLIGGRPPPARVQEALGELAGAAFGGRTVLSVGVGLDVLAELTEQEVEDVVGPGRHDPVRVGVRHGHEAGDVTLGGRRVAVQRPRVRSANGREEVPMQTYRR